MILGDLCGTGNIRGFACVTTNLVNRACQQHGTLPTASDALGRALTCGVMMGAQLKGRERVALKYEGGGPLKKILIEANSRGEVRGYVGVPEVDLPPHNGKNERSFMIRSITILGAGALGTAYAGLFFDMDPQSVSFVAQGERLARLKTDGVVVNGRHYNIPVISPDERAAPADLVIVALKHQHMKAALPDLHNVVGNETLILSVMNGLDSEQAIGALYSHDKVLHAISIGIDAVREGNRTIYSTSGKIMFGEAENRVVTDRVRRVQELFERAGIAYETPVDMVRAMWWKFMINVGINQTSAVLRAPYGLFQQSADARALMTSAMREVLVLAEKARVNINEDDVTTNWFAVLATLSPDGKTSMLQDIEAGRKTEVEMFAGKVIELGKTYGVSTPVNQTLFSIIRVFESN